MKVHNIMIVDDDQMITATLSRVVTIMLRQNVLAFNDPITALEYVSREKSEIDLVISDFIMPEINGIEFLKRLKMLRPDAVSILLTGYSDKKNAIAGINEIGIFHYMEKPWDNEVLIHTIQNGLEKKRLKDELDEKIIELEKRNLEIKDLYSRLEEEYKKETERNVTLEAAVAERTSSIRNLLDNAGQGFLSFGPDLKIDHDFSVECRRIFGRQIRDENFAELLYPYDEEQRILVGKLAEKVLSSGRKDADELYMPLLPDYIVNEGLHIKIEYRLINEDDFSSDRKLMAVLTDVTGTRELESRMEQEKNTFKMVIKVVTSPHDFSICLEEFKDFITRGASEIIMRHEPDEALNEIFRYVHTLKGNLSMYNMQKTVERLHAAEDKIIGLQGIKEPVGKDELLFLVGSIDFRSGFDADMADIKEILGDSYFASDSLIRIDRATLADLESTAARVLKPDEFMELAPYIRRLGYRKASDLFSSFLDYVPVLSEKNGKMIYPVRLTGGDTLIDQDTFSSFIRSLIHVFRNSVVHGIETPESRAEKGKNVYGTIFFDIRRTCDSLEFTIGDDGRGIDMEAVRQKALEKGIISESDASAMSDQDAVMLIFNDAFSTADVLSLYGGRGMGLSAVKIELEKLGGSVTIDTERDIGVHFHFLFPVSKHTDKLDAALIVEPAADCASRVIGGYMEGDYPIKGPVESFDGGGLELFENTVFISLKGQTEGLFFISFDKDLTGAIMEHMMPEMPHDAEESLIGEALSELSNITMGNCLGEFNQYGDYITMDTPFVMSSNGGKLSVPSSKILGCKIQFKCGICCVGIINKG